jgi:hypothetical protein
MEQSSLGARVYKMNWRGWVSPLFCFFVGAAHTIAILSGRIEPGHLLGILGPICLLLSGALMTAITFSSRIILTGDAIEERNILYMTHLVLSEIRGRREIVTSGWTGIHSRWKLEPKDEKLRTFKIGNYYTVDSAFREWLNQIPDLDAVNVD